MHSRPPYGAKPHVCGPTLFVEAPLPALQYIDRGLRATPGVLRRRVRRCSLGSDRSLGSKAVRTAPAKPRTNVLAVVGLVLGIFWIWWIGSFLALALGYLARHQIRASHGAQRGRRIAIASIVVEWIGVASIILTILAIWIFNPDG